MLEIQADDPHMASIALGRLIEETTKDLKAVEASIKAMDAEGVYPHDPNSYTLYLRYKATNQLPYGWVEGNIPVWWDDDRHYFETYDYWFDLMKSLAHYQERKRSLKGLKGKA